MNKFNAFIFARGGSKGIPKKNLQKVGKFTLVEHSIRIAKRLPSIERIFISTDSDEIASLGRTYKIEIINRPEELASDSSNEVLSWKHAINFVENSYGYFDNFLSIPPTSPLRIEEDIFRIMSSLNSNIDIVLGISRSKKSPWFNMVTNEGGIKLVNKSSQIFRRQDTPLIFDITTIAYAAKVTYLKGCNNILEGKVKGVEIPEERSIDIDNWFDLKLARLLIESRIENDS